MSFFMKVRLCTVPSMISTQKSVMKTRLKSYLRSPRNTKGYFHRNYLFYCCKFTQTTELVIFIITYIPLIFYALVSAAKAVMKICLKNQ